MEYTHGMRKPPAGIKLPFRCWQCWRRFTTRIPPPDRYCPYCGKVGLFLDKARLARNLSYRKLHLCHCDGYWFPHRKGSLKCCEGANYAGLQEPPEPPFDYVSPEEDDLPF